MTQEIEYRQRIKELEEADLSHLLYNSLPEIPKDFQEKLKTLGGEKNGFPLLRVVSGLDPEQTIFAAGQFHRKYVSAKDHVTRLDRMKIVSKRTQKEETITAVEGVRRMLLNRDLTLTNLAKFNYTVIPFVTEETVEYGIPRYIVEKYKEPQDFGSPEQWETNRYIDKNDKENAQGETIDVLGEFPREGRYEYFCRIEDVLVDDNGQVYTEFKPLTEQTFEEVKKIFVLNNQLLDLPPDKQMEKLLEASELVQKKHKEEFEDDLDQMAKSVRNKILGNPQIAVAVDTKKLHKGE